MNIILKQKNNGYTLLFAVLVSALVLGVGVSILNIARKELLLNEGARESQYAFYAADTGYECAVYWDSQKEFATSTYASPNQIMCGTTSTTNPRTMASSTVTGTAPPNGSNAYTFTFVVPVMGKQCAVVTVTKDYKQVLLGGNMVYAATTQIQSNGYNVGWNGTNCNATNPIKVERALLITY